MTNENIPLLKTKCPMCKEKSVYAFRPFCSKTCKDEDLNNWLGGKYVIPTEDSEKVKDGQDEEF